MRAKIKDMKKQVLVIMGLCGISNLLSQTTNDTMSFVNDTIKLKEISIEISRMDKDYTPKDAKNGVILIGKNYERIDIKDGINDVANNNARRSMAKIPGLSIWENEASGMQIGIASRGLSPNRSWEMNVRVNGYDVAADPYGYPEAYYNPPLEAVESIEMIRGSSSLAYGTQFGGLVNYQLKGRNLKKPIEIESRQSYGQYNFFSSYNSAGGKVGKWQYFTYYQYRKGDTWRQNNKFNSHNGFARMSYEISKKWKISAEGIVMDYLLQHPGGILDSNINKNPWISYRNRNWMNIQWRSINIQSEYFINDNQEVHINITNAWGERNSIGFLKAINLPDAFPYANRQVDRDKYLYQSIEARWLLKFKLYKTQSLLNIGYRFFNGQTDRMQKGKGTAESEYSLFLIQNYERVFDLSTVVNAGYIEWGIYILPKLKLSTGMRIENIQSSINGFLNIPKNERISQIRNRNVLLAGAGLEWKYFKKHFIYLNYTQNYRPILYSELIPSATTEIIDPALKDNYGSTSEIGMKGSFWNNIYYQITGFYLYYDNKIGSIQQNGTLYRTNIGRAENKGVEVLFDVYLFSILNKKVDFNAYYAGILQNFQYTKWLDASKNILHKKVEYAPDYIHRVGMKINHKWIQFVYQIQLYSSVYSDALNTKEPNASATVGLIPAYQLHDMTIQIYPFKHISLSCTINNLYDTHYATRRAGGYPGPGLMPGNGRNIYGTISIKF